ncbi:hypothetical protein M9Y10_030354 [Tritrichomonas musculus]|uniref:Uncharacterized protein n=1 Tax=Tritrichomonas musculus TaxID=1915356 RepID=A0ABR2KSZ5_9EUKA
MNDKNVFIIYPQNSPSSKYPTLKKSPESKKDIAFRLNFSSTKNQERNINHVMSTFEKPFTTLGVNSELKKQFTQIIIDLKATFKQIDKDHSNQELNQKFWEQWNQFDTILHQMSVHSAYYYCSREIERLTLDITGAIKSIKSNPPAVPGIQHEFSIIVEKIQKSFVQIVDRFAEIVDSKIDESKKIRDLESMRNQIRQFRTDIVGDRSKFFSLSSANHATQEKAKQTIETSLTTIIATISDLKRQTYLLDNLDNEITQAMRVIEMMIDGDPLPNAKSERIQEKVKIEKENLIENQPASPLVKSKSNLSRRCTINPSNNGNKNNRRSSRRRKSIKRNASLIDLERSASENESDVSFCSTLSEFQDGKELLFDSVTINAELSDIDEDSMFEISDDDSDDYENDQSKSLSSEKVIQKKINFDEDNEDNNDLNNIISPNKEVLENNKVEQLNDEMDTDENNDNEAPATIRQEIKQTNDNEDSNGCDYDINANENSTGSLNDNAKLADEETEKEGILDKNTIENTNEEQKDEINIQGIPEDENITQINEKKTQNDRDNNKDENINHIAELHISNFSGSSTDDHQLDIDCQKRADENEKDSILDHDKNEKDDDNDKRKENGDDSNLGIVQDTDSGSNEVTGKISATTALLPTSSDSGEEFLSSDLEEINIPLVCSCPVLTFEQVPLLYQLSTSRPLSFEKIECCNSQSETRDQSSSNCYMMFLLVCFIVITFFLLLNLNVQ